MSIPLSHDMSNQLCRMDSFVNKQNHRRSVGARLRFYFSCLMLSIILTGLSTPDTAEAQIRKWFFGGSDKTESTEDSNNEGRALDSKQSLSQPVFVYHIPMSRLEDFRSNLSHDYPDIFLISPAEVESTSPEDPTSGFRIQLFSTRDVSLADSILSQFRVQSDSLFAEYSPEAYLEFRQPYYKIHIGDFNNRDQAIQIARYLKRWYGDAWVVYDKIIPELVPADTVKILN